MCCTVKELNENVAEIKSLKALREELDNEIKALERNVISFLEETEECCAFDKKGNPIRRYIGSDFKATYAWQSRETVNKDEVKKLLSDEQYQKVSSTSTFPVLRIN